MPYELKPRCIIAMKGLPFTGKTECATLIAASLKCPVFSLDDFLDDLSSSPHPRNLALQIICRISKSHLSRGLVDNIVIDSPLSSRSHLDQIIELASYIPKTRLVIIECKPNNDYMWKTKFEEYAEANSESLAGKWYKPKDWDDVVNDINNDYDERSDGYEVSKLVFDPLSGYKMESCSRIYFFLLIGLPVLYSPPFMEAISYMITRDESQGPDLVVYDEWRRSNYTEGKSGQGICIGDSHSITNYTEELGLENEEAKYCTVCEQRITGAAYTCTACSLALHKECVESCSPARVTWDKLGSDCDSCKVYKRRGVPFDCPTCEFKRVLKRRAYDGVRSVVRHECDEHLLWLDTSSCINIVKCMACGDKEEGYMYSCKICGVVYHGTCLTEGARQVKHVHGEHHHRMLLKFSSPEGEEDYMCQECLEKRDPQLWFYSCEECPYEIHLACSLEGMEQDEEKSDLEEQDSESSESMKLETTDQSKCGDHNHKLTRVNEEEREYELNCMECRVEVKGAAYMCTDCNIPLHKGCVISYLRECYS